ncbi:host-nuclease inhibitor protein Gam [Helicobacter sp. 12S02634-8]|uniref:host-nuclease inhibitor Gam family protein n=1 Tax=Helicobacter sp. 12S02634-8 TaxID=1476199 RepID=UPI000BA58214|nr:host-nuclease inhibitor Gam family protein [Helicobacter sp. 12S02634-8]PAF47730.1 host-nuclease inhibitor protein Gam [Helicobacter sp. 12S02634-8]
MEIKNYGDVDLALKRICECEVGITQIEGEVTLKCNQIKEEAKPQIIELQNERNFLEQEIENFCSANKADFADKRSKELTFGTIGYRLSKSVSLPRAKAKIEGLISAIKKFGFKDCIVYEEKPNKEALCELDDSALVKLGITRVIKDNFRVEPKIESLQNVS